MTSYKYIFLLFIKQIKLSITFKHYPWRSDFRILFATGNIKQRPWVFSSHFVKLLFYRLMFPCSDVCKNNNWLGLWMAVSTVKLVLNKAWLEWPLGPFSDQSQLPEFIHSLHRYFWGPTTNQAMQNINLPDRWQTRATYSFGRTVHRPHGHYVCRISYDKTFSCWCFFSAVQSFSRVWLFVTPRTTAHQASLFITNSWSLLKLMSIELVMPSNHLILCCPLLLPSIFPSIRFHTEPHEQYEKHSVVWYKFAERNWTAWKYCMVKYAHGVTAYKNLKSNDALGIDSEAFMLKRRIEDRCEIWFLFPDSTPDFILGLLSLTLLQLVHLLLWAEIY